MSMSVPDQVSPELCRQKAEECVALSYQLTDPKKQVAVLKLANSWMRLAEHAFSSEPASSRRHWERRTKSVPQRCSLINQ
jgi:hypothetical protein